MKITLGDKEYHQDYVRAIALREIEGPMATLKKIQEMPKDEALPRTEMDGLVNWFCLFFGGQFTADEVWEKYPADQLRNDIFECIMYCQAGITRVLHDFPTKAEAIPQMKENAQ